MVRGEFRMPFAEKSHIWNAYLAPFVHMALEFGRLASVRPVQDQLLWISDVLQLA